MRSSTTECLRSQINTDLNPSCIHLTTIIILTLDGLGITNLPYLKVGADIASGRLVHILPDWCFNIGTVQLVYASRKGQRLVMEKLIEHLIQGLRGFASTSKGYHL
ncbi:LysR substrate-binding domain-containing protein [Acinetobacter johnsonii]|uniref:LysR substrate-binding domain-containing protein n=1 Tax=Acinetobacter johnsonii TaxID=40214 RepID=A0AA42IH69_ACIJO|nr:LysR substrate-binding domain-containing protein [Acinetobacter johnsonii]MDH0657413.1 LysR substrate-binding domain-containing protein [Acinetobacter johnsonii]